MRSVSLRPLIDLARFAEERPITAFGVTSNDCIYLAAALPPRWRRVTPSRWSDLADLPANLPQSYQVLAFQNVDLFLDVTIRNALPSIDRIQPVGDKLLLACARMDTDWRVDAERNGWAYRHDGTLLHEQPLGYGIVDLQTTAGGIIWASFSEEGAASGGPGTSRLAAWTAAGEQCYRFTPDGRLVPVIDFYALNVASENDVWCLYYQHRTVPLIHLHNYRVERVWPGPFPMARAVAVIPGYALFADGAAAWLFSLEDDGQAEFLDAFHFCDPFGRELEVQQMVARQSTLHLLSNGTVYRVSIEALM